MYPSLALKVLYRIFLDIATQKRMPKHPLQSVTKVANRQNEIFKTDVALLLSTPAYISIFVFRKAEISLHSKAFCLTAQLAPLEYPHTLRGRVACLGAFIDLCSLSKNHVF